MLASHADQGCTCIKQLVTHEVVCTRTGWSRSPQVALVLAELYIGASAQLAAAKTSSAGQPTKKSSTKALKHKMNSLKHGCSANLGLFEAALMQQDGHSSLTAAQAVTTAAAMDTDGTYATSIPTSASTLPEAGSVLQACHLQARYHWLQACISEQQKQMDDAAQQLEACRHAVSALAALTEAPLHEVSVATFPHTAAPITTKVIDQKLAELETLMMVEEGRKCLEQGQYQELISRLAPVLLSGSVALEKPHQLAGLQLLQVSHLSYTLCNIAALPLLVTH